MSTLKTTNIQHASATSANLVLASDGTVTGAAMASTSDITGVNTTGSVTSGQTSLTVASATGIVAGMFIVGEGIAPGTTVSNIVSTTVTMSANANATLSSDPVTFYAPNKIVSPAVIGGQLCRAWVNFDGTGTVAIRASYNVSSITDNGTGDYTVNFTTAMPDANYAVTAQTASTTAVVGRAWQNTTRAVAATGSIAIGTVNFGSSFADLPSVFVAIFR